MNRYLGSWLGYVVAIAIAGVMLVLSQCASNDQCDKLMAQAQTHADSLVVLTSVPMRMGSCQTLQEWRKILR